MAGNGRDDKKETPRERFVRLAPKRTQKALDAIRNVGTLGGRGYESTEADIDAIVQALDLEVERMTQKLSNQGASFELPID